LLNASKGKKFIVFALFLSHAKRFKIPFEYEKTSFRDIDACRRVFPGISNHGNRR
jgi:hypothetical protein